MYFLIFRSTPFAKSWCWSASRGTLLKALRMSIVVTDRPSSRHCAAKVLAIRTPLDSKQCYDSESWIYDLSLETSKRWNTLMIMQLIAIGLTPPSFLGINIAWNSYALSNSFILSGFFRSTLNESVSSLMKNLCSSARSFRCAAHKPVIPGALCVLRFRIWCSTSSSVRLISSASHHEWVQHGSRPFPKRPLRRTIPLISFLLLQVTAFSASLSHQRGCVRSYPAWPRPDCTLSHPATPDNR